MKVTGIFYNISDTKLVYYDTTMSHTFTRNACNGIFIVK